MANDKCDIGIIGLGVMGHNLALNLAEHRYRVSGYDKNFEKVRQFQSKTSPILAFEEVDNFIHSLKLPRVILLLVPAGTIVDLVIQELLPFLSRGDIVIDAGNSFFKSTQKRQQMLFEQGIYFLGVGVSGGEKGARSGPCLMVGGFEEAYQPVKIMFETIAAKVKNEPCVAYLGDGSAGHYVKMVHNGIEYGMMELIVETYDLLHHSLNVQWEELYSIYKEWGRGKLSSFLIEITADIFLKKDAKTGKRLLELIRDVAGQKGTGMWTSQEAMDLHVPLSTIDSAVMMRDMSALKSERIEASKILHAEISSWSNNKKLTLNQIERALYAGILITFAQGMALLTKASEVYHYHLDLEKVAKIWRGGCIIRAALLDQISSAFFSKPNLRNLFLDSSFAREISELESDLRQVVNESISTGIPVPGLASAIGYYDAYRKSSLCTNLIQAQRDYFGAHTYERIDEPGIFHTEW